MKRPAAARAHSHANAFTSATGALQAIAAVIAVAVTTLATLAPAVAQQCGAVSGGPPCETATGVASLGDPDGSDVAVGNPIHPITGNKYQEDVDAPPLPGFLGLEIRRHFNSSYASADGAWGKGWSLSYDTRLYRSPTSVQIVQADGRRIVFGIPQDAVADGEAPAAAQCLPAAPGQGQLFMESHGYRWLWPQQRELIFDPQGYLMQIRPRGGTQAEAVRIERGPAGRISRVTDPLGRAMDFGYDDNGYLNRIDHPLGRWDYRIDHAGRVEAVVYPDRTVRRYRYADMGHPSRFTAITVAAQGHPEKMIGQWSYDAQGRANRYRRADGSELRLDFQQKLPDPQASGEPPTTLSILTNALGGRTHYSAVEMAGKWRVTEIRGPGCEECGPGNLRMRYDAEGQLLARWRIGGSGLAYRRDRHGRVVRILVVAPGEAAVLERARGPARRIGTPPGRSGARPESDAGLVAATLRRFEYADDHTSLPLLVARPSVVPGKEHQLTLDRNQRGDIVRLAQTGFAPDVSGQPGVSALPIAEVHSLRYEQIAGRQVLVELDGPLPNGARADPSDSDVTRFHYDEAGRFGTSVDVPGSGSHEVLGRDAAGRPLATVFSDGHREVEERLEYNLSGQAVMIRRTAWLIEGGHRLPRSAMSLQYRRSYDAQGRLEQVTDPLGRIMRREHDAAGRLQGVSDSRGYRSALTRDAEGHVTVAALHQPGGEGPLRAAYYGRDDHGRLLSLLLPDGRLLQFLQDRDGRSIGLTGPHSLLHLTLPSGVSPVPDSVTRDDFGRVLRRQSPDHGVTTMRYDEAGRIVATTDAVGVQTVYRYDAADRVLVRSANTGAGDITYRYEGAFLAAVDDPAQATRHRRDSLGRIVETTTLLAGLPGPPLRVLTSRNPETGRVTTQGLADGQSVQIVSVGPDEGGGPRELRLRAAFWTVAVRWLERWLPAEAARAVVALVPTSVIVRNIEVHPFDGITSFAHGNGTTHARQSDPAGRAVRLLAGGPQNPIAHWRYAYGTGPRIRSIEQVAGSLSPGPDGVRRQQFAYDAFGALKTGPDGIDTGASRLVSHPAADGLGTEVGFKRDAAGRVVDDGRFRYAYSAAGLLEQVREQQEDRLVASYVYNHRGQRTMKTVYGENGVADIKTFFLWNDRRMVAEIEPDGTLVAQYLSLDDGHRHLLVARLQGNGRSSPGKGGGTALLAVHTDHRGAPVAMSDAGQRVVWRADLSPSGITEAQESQDRAQLNLRLPGQYLDEETGLHDNWHRSYDPRRGRYLQPDPLGYPDGPDPYTYAGGDPVNRVDPLGLYQIDVHYYMTFFLGVTAGMDPQEARIVALAAQYVDDNPLTRPVDSSHVVTAVGSILHNQRQLLGYHFVLSGAAGRTLPAYRNDQLTNADSPQLQNLLNAARNFGIGRNTSLQFLGEYLHALADTYSHRDAHDHPYDALFANCGVGHGLDLHEPDLTYDDVNASPGQPDEGQPPAPQNWHREARTLEMEQRVHAVLLAYGEPSGARPIEELEPVLRAFNAIRENDTRSPSDFAGKIALLQQALVQLGYGRFALEVPREFGYDVEQAGQNRRGYLSGQPGEEITEEGYPGVCLEGGNRCKSR